MEPILALQTAIRARLLDKPEVTALVPADHIRAGSTRPEMHPCITMGDGTTTLHGNDYRNQSAAWVYLDLHIWTLNTGQDAAKQITATVAAALSKYNLPIEGGYCDHFRVTDSRFPRDPDPAAGHGVLSVEALIRWIV